MERDSADKRRRHRVIRESREGTLTAGLFLEDAPRGDEEFL